MWRWCTTSRSVVKCSLLVWIFIRKYGAVSIICFVLEGASVESHRFVLLFPPHTGHGGKAFCSLCWCWCCRGLEVGIYCVVLNCAKSRRRRGWRWWATALCCGDKVNTPQIRCYHSTDPRVTPSICRPVLFDAFYISAGTFYVSTRHHVGCHCYCKDLPVLARWQCGGKIWSFCCRKKIAPIALFHLCDIFEWNVVWNRPSQCAYAADDFVFLSRNNQFAGIA